MISAFLLAASIFSLGSYSCEMSAPGYFYVDGDKVTLRHLGYPGIGEKDWSFNLDIGDFGAMITTNGSDPLGISGVHKLMKTGEQSFSLAAYSPVVSPDIGKCRMTDAGCVTSMHFIYQPNGSLKFLATPTGLMYYDDEKVPEAMAIYAPGNCKTVERVK